jgi:hypothetical protein
VKEYIDKEKAIETIRLTYCKDCNNYNGVRCRACEFDDAMMEIEDCPTADVVEVRYGKWVSASNKSGVNIGMKCSLCGARIKYSEFFNGNHHYCHKCGAKMDGERKAKA